MKTYDEIKEIITQRYGFTSIEKYKEWLTVWREKGGTATQEEADLLSPDNIDCHDFWRVCYHLFGSDSVCNAVDGAVYTNDMDANRINLSIAQLSGITSIIDANKFYRVNMLEYGPGLGCVKNYVEVNTRFNYYGFDVHPRIPGIAATTNEGYIPTEFVDKNKGSFQIVFSSNVLQHVSQKQRQKFFADAYDLLSVGGTLAFNAMTFDQNAPPLRYMTLYGQFILIPTVSEIVKELQNLKFTIMSLGSRQEFHGSFIVQKQKV